MSNRLIRALAIGMAAIGVIAVSIAIGLEWLSVGASGFGSQQWGMLIFGIVLMMLAAGAIACTHRGRRGMAIGGLKIGTGMLATAMGLVAFQAVKLARHRIADHDRIAKVAAVQELLRTDDDLGYLYKPNLNVLIPDELQWLNADVEGIAVQPITTDDDGFDNHPDAIATQDGPVDIIGLGDSFIDGATRPFFEIFRDSGYRYHSYAMHRHCPPQYNQILQKYALDRAPTHVFYGIYVNDFWETADFELWQKSGEDWFTYHGGTWCGPPRSMPMAHASEQLDQVLVHAIDAAEACAAADIDFMVWLIPSKDFIVDGIHADLVTTGYDRLSRQLREREIAVLDLREVLADQPNPKALFWRQDAHWSHAGMRLAADAYCDLIDGDLIDGDLIDGDE